MNLKKAFVVFILITYIFTGKTLAAVSTDLPDFIIDIGDFSFPYGIDTYTVGLCDDDEDYQGDSAACDEDDDGKDDHLYYKKIYVISMSDNAIYVYDMTGNLLDSYTAEGSGNGQFSSPFGIAVDTDENIYVADTGNNRIQKFDSNFNFIKAWGSVGSGDGLFQEAWGIEVTPDGYVYVADQTNNYIQKFDTDGNFIRRWGGTGSGNGQFNEPTDVAVDSNGNVFVSDLSNKRIQKFDSSGNYISSINESDVGNGDMDCPMGIALDSDDNVYVGESCNTEIMKFNNSGTLLTSWGSYGDGPGEFYQPWELTVDEEDFIYVLDYLNMNIQRFGYASVIEDIGDDCNTVLAEDGVTDVTATAQYGSKVLRVNSLGLPLADVETNFHKNRDWGDVKCGVNTADGKSFLYLDGTNTGRKDNFTLFVPMNGKNSVIVCPGARSLGDVTSTCINSVAFSGSFPQTKKVGDDDVTVSLVQINAEDFWKIMGVTGTGGLSFNSPKNTFHKDTRCLMGKPPKTTRINFTNTTNGLLLTWIQYSADKVTIEIDDGSGLFPWKIYKTLNDGHELLKNVQPWQKVRIRPYNHCKSGEYSLNVSPTLFPQGWFNLGD